MNDPATAVLRRLCADPNLKPEFAHALRTAMGPRVYPYPAMMQVVCHVCAGQGRFGSPETGYQPCTACNTHGWTLVETEVTP